MAHGLHRPCEPCILSLPPEKPIVLEEESVHEDLGRGQRTVDLAECPGERHGQLAPGNMATGE